MLVFLELGYFTFRDVYGNKYKTSNDLVLCTIKNIYREHRI